MTGFLHRKPLNPGQARVPFFSAPAPILALTFYAALGLTLVGYWPGLSGPFLLDDVPNLEPLQQLENGITRPTDLVWTNQSGPLGRPVSNLTFIGDYLAAGALDPRRFKSTNLALHLLTGCVLFWWLGRLLQHAQTPAAWWVALGVTSGWLLAPIQVSTVLYVVQRMSELSALFLSLGILLFVVGRKKLESDSRTLPGRLLLLLSATMAWPLAVLSKETGLILPLLLLLIEIFFFRFRTHEKQRVFLWLFVSTALIAPLALALGAMLWRPDRFFHYSGRGFSLYERVLTEARVLWDYARHILVPYSPDLGVIRDDYPISRGLFDPPTTALAGAGWVAAVAFAVWTYHKTELRLIGFGVLFFLTGHLLESTVFPLEIYFEHRNYLPSVGIFLAFAAGLSLLLKKSRRTLPFVLVGLLPLGYASATYQRAAIWSSAQTLLVATATAHPNSIRTQEMLAQHFRAQGDLEGTLRHYRWMFALDARFWLPLPLMEIDAYCASATAIPPELYGEFEDRVQGFEPDPENLHLIAFGKIIEAIQQQWSAGTCELDMRRIADAVDRFLGKTDFSGSSMWRVRINAGQYWDALDEVEKANANFDAAWRLDPKDLQPLILKAQMALRRSGCSGATEALAELQARDRGGRADFTNWVRAVVGYCNDEESRSIASPSGQSVQ